MAYVGNNCLPRKMPLEFSMRSADRRPSFRDPFPFLSALNHSRGHRGMGRGLRTVEAHSERLLRERSGKKEGEKRGGERGGNRVPAKRIWRGNLSLGLTRCGRNSCSTSQKRRSNFLAASSSSSSLSLIVAHLFFLSALLRKHSSPSSSSSSSSSFGAFLLATSPSTLLITLTFGIGGRVAID